MASGTAERLIRPTTGDVTEWQAYGQPLLIAAAGFFTLLAFRGALNGPAQDFHTIHASGQYWVNGIDPYAYWDAGRGSNLNPPFVLVLLWPLWQLPLTVALACWSCVSLGALAWTARIVAVETGLPAIALAAVVLVSQIGFLNIGFGQVAFVLSLLVTLAWRADRRGQAWAAGLWLGLATAWKPFLALFLLYFLWRRAWRSAVGLVLTAIATTAAGITVVGWSAFQSWIAGIQAITWEAFQTNVSWLGVVRRTLEPPLWIPTTPVAVAPDWSLPAWALLGAVTAIATGLVLRRRDRDRQWTAVTLVALLLTPLAWVFYVALAMGPLAAAITTSRQSARICALVAGAILCFPFMWLKTMALGPIASLVIGSCYAWAVVLLLIAVLMRPAQHT